jgi:hypothetical protein
MATFVVCTRCGRVQEVADLDQLPDQWSRSPDDLLCPLCGGSSKYEIALDDVIDEEVLYNATDDALVEDFCEVCTGPCQGH